MIYFLVFGALMLFTQIRILYAFVSALGFHSRLSVSRHPKFYYLKCIVASKGNSD